MAPIFPGIVLQLREEKDIHQVRESIHTDTWRQLSWGTQLMTRNINLLICAGIDQFLWGALRGTGIDVIPNATGTVNRAIGLWRVGLLRPPATWPPDCRRLSPGYVNTD